ncbi:MAG: hypothetical protein JWO74_2614 [Solirubrobacterales bacterium]|jgi:hypothetical protein|nr:hypothetical protein [Solirubrobacterales bacterium]
MHKVALLAAVAAVGAVGVTGVAHAVDADQGLAVSSTSKKAGTPAKPKNLVKLTVTTTTTPHEAAPAYATQKAIIHFDKNMVFGSAKFPSCTKAQAEAVPISPKCAAAKVGSGSATAVVAAINANPTLKVTAYNGPGGKKLWLLVTEPTFQINSVLDGTLSSDTGKYGKKLTVLIPANLQQPIPGVYATLTSFSTSVGGTATKAKVPYVALKGCTGSNLNYGGDFYFTDGDVKKVTATSKCTK